MEVNNYYPFGLLHDYTATSQNAYQYKFLGQELQENGFYDLGARFYVPELNTGFGAAGNWGGSIGASLSTVYFGVDSFYPGGWSQLFDDGNMV